MSHRARRVVSRCALQLLSQPLTRTVETQNGRTLDRNTLRALWSRDRPNKPESTPEETSPDDAPILAHLASQTHRCQFARLSIGSKQSNSSLSIHNSSLAFIVLVWALAYFGMPFHNKLQKAFVSHHFCGSPFKRNDVSGHLARSEINMFCRFGFLTLFLKLRCSILTLKLISYQFHTYNLVAHITLNLLLLVPVIHESTFACSFIFKSALLSFFL